MPLTPRAGFDVSVSEPDPETVLMTIRVTDGTHVKGQHAFTLKKHPSQSTDDLCRAAFPLAFEQAT